MSRSIERAWVWSALAALGLGGAALAQEPGDRVTPNQTVELKVKDRVTGRATKRDVLTVEKTNEDWLWVRTPGGVHGWVQKTDVTLVVDPPPASAAPAAPDEEAATEEGEAVDERLYLIGAMGATQVYLTYAYVGAVGDGFVKETYDAAKVGELMGEVTGMTANLVTQLQKVRDGDLTEEDRKALDQMIEINSLLKRQAESLSAFSQAPSAETAQAFEDVRTQVWPKIADLLGISEGEAEATPEPDDDE
ncbi:MAG: hypothetical protein KF774_19820 [Planctomyces sp.]|nr:hypothetical protein [Planctomyces sp.]